MINSQPNLTNGVVIKLIKAGFAFGNGQAGASLSVVKISSLRGSVAILRNERTKELEQFLKHRESVSRPKLALTFDRPLLTV